MARSVIILTGANGKLGGNLVKQFSREYDVIYLSLRPSNFLQNLNEIKLSLADRMNDALLVHAAWPVSRIDYRNHEDNKVILGKSKKLIKAFTDVSSGNIFGIGSIAEVGSTPLVFDDTPSNPECLYSECKSELQEWVLNKTQNSTWLRVGYQFSAFDPQHKLFPMLLNEKTPNLRNPNRKYDFIHVSDVARAIQRVLKVDLPRKILISNGRSYSSTEIARALGIRHTISANEDAFEQKTFPIFLKSLPWEPIYSEVSSFRNALNSEVNK